MANTWKVKAEGGGVSMVADAAEIRRALGLFADPAAGCELMALTKGVHRTRAGADVEGLAGEIPSLPSGIGIYFRINPVPATLDRPANNVDILKRRWVYIDVDPVKAEGHKDDPASDAEKDATTAVCDGVVGWLAGHGWPTPVIADSGNGYGLLYPCDLANDKVVQALYRKLLNLIGDAFDGPNGVIDRSVHNANRLVKLPGTWARKGVQSDDRPHRPCRLFFVPEVLNPVTLEMIRAAAGSTGEPQAPPERPWVRPEKGGGYGKTALDAECARVALTRSGGRNNALNRAAFSLGQLVAGGVLSREEVEARLYDAACRSGLDTDPDCGEKGIRATIASGLGAGLKEPRGVPEKNDPWAKFNKKEDAGQPETTPKTDAEPPPDAGPASLTVRMSQVERLEVEWLMKDRIAKRFITILAGRTGIGKSFVALDLIARISTGSEIPLGGGECFKAGGALILSEDSHEYVLAPRLIDAGANLDRVHAMTWKAMGEYHLADTGMLGKAVDEVKGGVDVVLIDPPTNFTAGADGHKDSEIRQLVMRVVEWAFSRDLAVLFVLHVNKNAKGTEALSRIMGSVAWVSTSRVAHALCQDPHDKARCFWMPLKNNIGPLAKSLAYRIEDSGGGARVDWLEEVDVDPDNAMSGDRPKERRDITAGKWLVDRFNERREWESEDLFERGKQEGISRNAIFEAKKALDLPKARRQVKENGDVTFLWWVPADWKYLNAHPPTGQSSQP